MNPEIEEMFSFSPLQALDLLRRPVFEFNHAGLSRATPVPHHPTTMHRDGCQTLFLAKYMSFLTTTLEVSKDRKTLACLNLQTQKTTCRHAGYDAAPDD